METEIFQLDDIDIGRLQLIKETFKRLGNQDHSRWVFKDRDNSIGRSRNTYFKIWNPTYVRRDNILKAVDAGFLDETTTPALSGIIFHKGLCRGYVMQESKPDWKLELDAAFYETIKKRSVETGYFHIQFSPCHVMKYNGKSGLIDLEGIFPISALPHMPESHCYFDYEDYEDFITDLYNKTIAGGDGEFRLPDHGIPRFRRFPPFLRIGQTALLKAADLCRKKRGMHTHRIEK